MTFKFPELSPLKALLKANQNSPRNYASVIAVWNHETPAWTWTDGFSVIGQGDIGKEPEALITLKDLEYKAIDGRCNPSPFVPHENARRPGIKYPNVTAALKPSEVLASVDIDIDLLLQAVKALKGLSNKRPNAITIEIQEDFVRLKKQSAWAVLLPLSEDPKQ